MKLYECTKCKEFKPEEGFHFRPDIKKYRKKCKVCRRLHHYDYNLQRRYNITLQKILILSIQLFDNL